MGRPKTFNPEHALDKAMELFWCRGYENTSMQDLVDAMGINRGSLYDTYGDKHALYLKALDRYIDTHSIRVIAEQDRGKASRDILKSMLYCLADCDPAEKQTDRGCLMTNSICELCSRDPDVLEVITRNLNKMQSVLERVIDRGKADGEFADGHDSRVQAQFFLNTLQGMQVMRKAHTPPQILRQIADQALAVLH